MAKSYRMPLIERCDSPQYYALFFCIQFHASAIWTSSAEHVSVQTSSVRARPADPLQAVHGAAVYVIPPATRSTL
jgi:hypothetical protein